MSGLRREAARVLVPATSANLGPAFDCAGLALDLCDEYVAMISDDATIVVEVTGEGAGVLKTDSSHLVAQSIALALRAAGEEATGFVLRCTNAIPHGRGLGSSASAIIGGLVLGRALLIDGDARLSDDDLLQLALQLESHPDNLAAALHGGFTISWLDADSRGHVVRQDAHPELRAVVAIPEFEVATKGARAALPAQVSHADAAFNAGRSALLVHAVTRAPEYLLAATEDRLHQEPRRGMYVPSMDLVDRLRAQGIPAAISGAGPTVIALVSADEADAVVDMIGDDWAARVLEIRAAGAGS